jgi:hypothetical protein
VLTVVFIYSTIFQPKSIKKQSMITGKVYRRNDMGSMKSGRRNTYKYVGSEHSYFVKGKSYTYRDIERVTGLKIATIRTRMGQIEGKVITDAVIAPRQDAFCNADGTYFSQAQRQIIPDRCETESEKMMNKYLRRAL